MKRQMNIGIAVWANLLEANGTSRQLRLERLLERSYRPVVSFLYRLVEDQVAAEQLAKEALLKGLKDSRAVGEQNAALLMYKTAIALAAVHKHSAERTGDASRADSRLPHQVSHDAESRVNAIRRSIRKLPEQQRLALILHKYQGLEFSQIGIVLGISDLASRALLMQAYDQLRAELGMWLQ